MLETDLLHTESKISGVSSVSEFKIFCASENYYECIYMTYYPQVGAEAANTLIFLHLRTRLFTPSRISRDCNK